MRIQILDSSTEEQYDTFLKKNEYTLLYASNKYRKFLIDILGDEDRYLLAVDKNSTILGALPLFLKKTPYGNILNSLPFFGSNGGIVEFQAEKKVHENLLAAFKTLGEENKCLTCTIITSPFSVPNFLNILNPQKNNNFYLDERIGQITSLPNSPRQIKEKLLASFSPCRRRNINKVHHSGITSREGYDSNALFFLQKTHIENMKEINGRPKPDRFFEILPCCFDYGKDYKIYTAIYEDSPVAALLLFYFNKTVEYYITATLQQFRSLQPSALLIFEAMQDATSRGYKWWNWGGTWLSQAGVYNFKKRWGAVNNRYLYYCQTHNPKIFTASQEELQNIFSFYYVLPYQALKNQ